MFLKGKKNSSENLDIVDLNEQRDTDIENLFKASTFDTTSRRDKIIIRENKNTKGKSSHWADLVEDEDLEPKKKARRDKEALPKDKSRKKYFRFLNFLEDDDDEEEEEKKNYVPLASELGNNKVDSDFRKQSSDWMDKDYKLGKGGFDDLNDDGSFFSGLNKKIILIQCGVGVLAILLLVLGMLTAASSAKNKCLTRRVEAFEKLRTFEASEGDMVAKEVESIEAPLAAEVPEPEEKSILSLILSSVEKDLKIKLVDEDELLVKDIDWSVTVTDNDGISTEEEDDDRDGIIHMTDISAGDYTVELNPSSSLMDYELPTSAQTVSVKAKIEYKVIANIKEEIKTEKEVNAAVEDVGNRPADVEQTAEIQDTVEWVESSKTSVGSDRYEESEVDLKKTVKNTNGGRLAAFLESLKASFRASFGKYSTVAYPLILAESPESPESGISESAQTDDSTTEKPATDNNENTNPETPSDTKEPEKPSEPENPETPKEPDKPKEPENLDPGNIIEPEKPSTTTTETEVIVPSTSETVSSTTEVITDPGSSSSSDTSVKHSYLYKPEKNGQHSAKCSITGCKDHPVITAEACTYGSDNKCILCGAENPELSKYSDTAQLYDSDMNELYIYDGGTYRLAKFSDYKKDSSRKFYKKLEEFLYTGWQTIDGKRYYYTKDNVRVTGDQIIGGVQYHFGTDGALSVGTGKLGIDVSKYQPSINWSSVKKSGIDYVIIRCGYRGSDTGVLIEDPYFRSHIKGAKAAGLKVGVYFFTTAVTEAEAVEEASMVAYLCSNYGIDYPVFMDCESSPRAGYNGMSAGQRTAIIKAFCNTIRSAGYTPGVYANKTWLSSYMNASELSGYKIWLAQYNSAPTYTGRYDLWQYTSKGRVDGISGNVDMNQSYLGY